jgi:peptide/nickel transport system permease protein
MVPLHQILVRRAGYALLSLLLLTATIFVFTRATGDPAALMAGVDATQADIQRLRTELGVDKPLPQQFMIYISDLVRGDLGTSLYYKVPVSDLIVRRLPATMGLIVATFVLSLLIGIPLGVYSAVRPGGLGDRLGNALAMFAMAVPGFWLGLVLILVFSVTLRWLPSGGIGGVSSVILPAVALSGYFIASHLRITRSAMLDVLGSEYIRFTRAKGLSEWRVIAVHALRNSLIPIVTLAGINLALILNASIAVEAVFNWPGIGLLLYESISLRDFPVAQGVVLVVGALVIIFNLVVDVLYGVIDPRVSVRA